MFSKESLQWTIQNNWFLVILSSIFFLSFLFLLKFRKKTSWKHKGLYSAFIISLFVEMYGFPLTIYFISNYVFKNFHYKPDINTNIDILGFEFGLDKITIFGGFITLLGILFIILGWIELYKNIKPNKIVKSGIYKYSRHPQYFGFILIVLGWFIAWPSLLTLIMAPILIYSYLSLCFKEEREIFSKEYDNYKKVTPLFI
jgi:protein-S-isoprenylcysteine O-methyltransferase Ste14